MKYISSPKELFIKNRRKFSKYLTPNSLAIFNYGDVCPIGMIRNYLSSNTIFYLSGIDQQDSILLLYPKAYQSSDREILFLKKSSRKSILWEGSTLDKEQAFEISGIATIYWLDQFNLILNNLMSQVENVYLNLNEQYRDLDTYEVKIIERRFIEKIKKKFPLHIYKRSNPILQRLRSIKEPEEIDQLKIACDITGKGFRRALTFVKPGIWEYEIEAEWVCEFLRRRASGFAYRPIIASGPNTCIIHYTKNNKQCQKGELLLMDVGACYARYNADLTRTLPVNGRYSERQRKVYNAVLRVKNKAEKMLIPGNNWYDFNKEIGYIMTDELLSLNLLDKADVQNGIAQSQAYKKYFIHGISHHLGLDTHDYGILSDPFQPGMVFTIEPGIYIPEESLGIRIEDDYVIQENGPPKNMMKDIPIQIEEIEDLMNQS